MPPYLTISDDLQIIPSQGCSFLSRSGRDLATVEADVSDWVERNSDHPRFAEAEQWLAIASDEIQRHLSITDRKEIEDAAIKEMERSLRQFARAIARSKGWSKEKTRQEEQRQASMAAKLLGLE